MLLNPFPRRGLRERRRMALAAIAAEDTELCVASLHASAGNRRQAEQDVVRAARLAVYFARGRPLVLGGDLNLRPRSSSIPVGLGDRFGLAPPTAPDAIDHLLVRGLEVLDAPRRWAPERRELPFADPGSRTAAIAVDPRGSGALRLRLSDHAPVEGLFALPQPGI